MKLKRYHLLLIATVCFFTVFIGINRKYDRFYRIQGMNNDNRILIESYLDEDQQNYIIQNNIPVSKFIEYIKLDDFTIYNYEYYNLIEEKEVFTNLQDIVTHTNNVIDKLNVDMPWSVMDNLNRLIDNDLVIDYELNDDFKFDYIQIYSSLKPYYALEEDSYITIIDSLMESLGKIGYSGISDCQKLLENMFVHYSPSQVLDLIDYAVEFKKVNFLMEPDSLIAIVDQNHYISDYVPTSLTVINEIPRLSYFTYLNKEAYEQLKLMFEAYNQKEKRDAIMVVEGYKSHESLPDDIAGFDETQLGFSVSFKVEGISISEFDNTDFKKWLNEHAYEYGFILRYPQGKEDITMHDYKNNLYRYIGKEAASLMYEKNIKTLEEYCQSQDKEDL